jgi:hypothetical protein
MRRLVLALVIGPLVGTASFAQQPATEAKSGQAMAMKYETLQ